MEKLKTLIDETFANAELKPENYSKEIIEAVEKCVSLLDQGELRVVERTPHGFTHHEWVKKAILLFFRIRKIEIMKSGDFSYADKVPVKQWTGKEGVRVVPHALARYGSFIEPGAILMPSYVNIGARVCKGTMVDTWATVGSCAYVGANVHLSGGVGIGGVLEPVQARPVVIEDNAFLGSRCIVVEGVHIGEGAVLGAGVTITGSTKIIDVTGPQPLFHEGVVPKNSVVIPGTMPKQFTAGSFGVPCALIIGQRKESTNLKTSLTDALREHNVAV